MDSVKVSGVSPAAGMKPQVKLHLFRQDLQDYQDSFWFSISILSILPARAKSRFEQDEDGLILSKNWGLIIASATLHFAGWVEPISGYVGFRFTQPYTLSARSCNAKPNNGLKPF